MKSSRITAVISYSGGQITLREGQTLDDNHPIVAERPELFDDIEASQARAEITNPSVVQTAMADGPGGSRVQRRPASNRVTGQ